MAQRILHVPRRFAQSDWGGTESVILHLCQEQQKQGGQPEIHTSRALHRRARETWRAIPIRRYRYCYPFFGLSSEDRAALDRKGGNLLSLDLFAHLLAAPDVRLYHAHVLKRMGGSVLTAARLRKKPFLATLHGNVFDVPPSEARSLIAPQEGKFEWGKPFGALFRSRQLLEEADAVLCVGHSEYEKAQAALPHDRVHYLANGVTPESFEGGNRATGRSSLGWPETALVFGCLSRIDPQKNQQVLLAALPLARAMAPELDLRVLLGGPVTAPDYLLTLENEIESHGLGDCVRILPAVEAESPAHRDLLAAMDGFVLPSRHEPFGIVVLEAWAAGLPVIVSKVGGLQRLVDHQSDGLHFESNQPEALAQALLDLARHPQKRAALAEAGRGKTRRHFTWKAIAERLETIYQKAEERVQARKA
ncbi:MAG: glycosyltransferase family 4 protein [Verrucomicrobiota bacterium]